MTSLPGRAAVAVACLLLAGCALLDARPTPAVSPALTTPPTAAATLAPTPSGPTPTVPSASPEQPPDPLALELPAARDERRLAVTVTADVPPDAGGQILLTLTNLSDSRIDEIVLRWATDLRQTLVLAPFVPAEDRIRDGGPPLVQPWTKWVEGPGEAGEPTGTTSLGYGPMDAGMTLEVPIYVTRIGPGPVAFDLHLLAGEALLALDDGSPGELRVEVQ